MSWYPVPDVDARDAAEITCTQAGGRDLVLVRSMDRWFALDRQCPHSDADLSAGTLVASAIKCPRHGFMFDLETGAGLGGVQYTAGVYEVSEEDGRLYVDLAD